MATLTGRLIYVGVVALATAVFVIRDAYVAAYAGPAPRRAAAIWPDHPQVLLSKALTDIGLAAVKRKPPPPAALVDIGRAARIAPLGHDAFLVRGVAAEQAGDLRRAERAFSAARLRAPREAGPRYFLSELYLRTGRGADGLRELATLARLLPNGSEIVAPSLAAYATSSGDIAGLKAAFRNHPDLERRVLIELAKDPSNADLAMRLASRMREPDGSAVDWVRVILPKLVKAGQVEHAYRLWDAVDGESGKGLLFNPSFRPSKAPPPFNWTYRSDSTGFAEGNGKGGLHVLFYGREDSVLANQTLLLPPGRYRLAMKVDGNPGGMLRWSLTCLPSTAELFALELGASAQTKPAIHFIVGSGCPAQLLELKGRAGEMARQVDITISRLTLTEGSYGQ
ncbi:MAG TPA: hypothetical protein VFK50_01455 [Sphingomicrobium sp.]|nr:hypothetical protein [Sphingomicrobium sp.]